MEGSLKFRKFDKIPRLNRDMIITEKIDGTNAQVTLELFDNLNEEEKDTLPYVPIFEDSMIMLVGSRNRYLSEEKDNYGFFKWCVDNKEGLANLGLGRHYGEWWGAGIQRKYGMHKKVFSLFNTHRWLHDRPVCCDVVPVLYEGPFSTLRVREELLRLMKDGSHAAAKYVDKRQPAEGVVIYHKQGNFLLKATLENDDIPKSLVKE